MAENMATRNDQALRHFSQHPYRIAWPERSHRDISLLRQWSRKNLRYAHRCREEAAS